MSIERTANNPKATAEDTIKRLVHMDSVFCWCDPLLEVDDTGQEVVIHREVTWN